MDAVQTPKEKLAVRATAQQIVGHPSQQIKDGKIHYPKIVADSKLSPQTWAKMSHAEKVNHVCVLICADIYIHGGHKKVAHKKPAMSGGMDFDSLSGIKWGYGKSTSDPKDPIAASKKYGGQAGFKNAGKITKDESKKLYVFQHYAILAGQGVKNPPVCTPDSTASDVVGRDGIMGAQTKQMLLNFINSGYKKGQDTGVDMAQAGIDAGKALLSSSTFEHPDIKVATASPNASAIKPATLNCSTIQKSYLLAADAEKNFPQCIAEIRAARASASSSGGSKPPAPTPVKPPQPQASLPTNTNTGVNPQGSQTTTTTTTTPGTQTVQTQTTVQEQPGTTPNIADQKFKVTSGKVPTWLKWKSGLAAAGLVVGGLIYAFSGDEEEEELEGEDLDRNRQPQGQQGYGQGQQGYGQGQQGYGQGQQGYGQGQQGYGQGQQGYGQGQQGYGQGQQGYGQGQQRQLGNQQQGYGQGQQGYGQGQQRQLGNQQQGYGQGQQGYGASPMMNQGTSRAGVMQQSQRVTAEQQPMMSSDAQPNPASRRKKRSAKKSSARKSSAKRVSTKKSSAKRVSSVKLGASRRKTSSKKKH